jgi:NAD dependent epimerase/dehydratase family enzyme
MRVYTSTRAFYGVIVSAATTGYVFAVAEWEAAARNVPSSTRSVIIRTGIVLARDGGVLARMLPIFELFAGE